MEDQPKFEPDKMEGQAPAPIQRAIAEVAVVNKTMEQASADLGFRDHYLNIWEQKHPDLYRQLYLSAVEESDLDDDTRQAALDRLNDSGRQDDPEAAPAGATGEANGVLDLALGGLDNSQPPKSESPNLQNPRRPTRPWGRLSKSKRPSAKS